MSSTTTPSLRDVPGLGPNLSLLSEREQALAAMLLECDQAHLFAGWPGPGEHDDDKHAFFKQVRCCC